MQDLKTTQYEKFTIINELIKADLIKYGSFVLKSGRSSNIYFDFKGLNNHPVLVNKISRCLCDIINSLYDDKYCIAGVPLGAISYATHVSYILNRPMILIREEQKNYGLGNQIEGCIQGLDVILIEDVITSGQSVIKVLDILKANNVTVRKIICILDREEGGVLAIEKLGHKVISLFKTSDIKKNSKL